MGNFVKVDSFLGIRFKFCIIAFMLLFVEFIYGNIDLSNELFFSSNTMLKLEDIILCHT